MLNISTKSNIDFDLAPTKRTLKKAVKGSGQQIIVLHESRHCGRVLSRNPEFFIIPIAVVWQRLCADRYRLA